MWSAVRNCVSRGLGRGSAQQAAGEIGTGREMEEESRATSTLAQAVRRGVETIYATGVAIAQQPQEDMKQDLREFGSPLQTHFERSHATIKLEQMSQTSIVFSLSLLYFASILCLASAIVIAVTSAQIDQKGNSGNDDMVVAALVIEGVCRTLAILIVALLALFFSFRQAKYHAIERQAIQQEQLLLCWILILLMATPGMSVYSPVLFWKQYAFAMEFGPELYSGGNNPFNFTLGEAIAVSFFQKPPSLVNVQLVTAIMSVLLVSYGLAYFGLTTVSFGSETGSSPNLRALLRSLLLAPQNRKMGLVSLMYSVIFIPLIIVFRFMPSVVPFVGIITLFKSTSFCAPPGIGFQRAMVLAAQFLYELAAIWYLHRMTERTKLKLKTMPYEAFRAKQLGFRYFNSNKHMMVFFALLSAILVSACTAQAYNNYDMQVDTETGTVVASLDPLRQVGISFFTLGFGPFYLLLASFLLALSYANLPPDSRDGVRGFCCGGRKCTEIATSYSPIYLAKASDVAVWKRRVEEEEENARQFRRGPNALDCAEYQIKNQIFCLETEVLLLNLAFLTYCTDEVLDHHSRMNQFRIVKRVINSETEIQCDILQRVDGTETTSALTGEIFLSFRGTISKVNVWQDLDYFTMPPETRPGEEVEPLIDALDPFQRASAQQAPLVHRGFYRAYLSIRDECMSIITALVEGNDRNGTILFCAGHSLGGALATLFAADIASKYHHSTSIAVLRGVQLSTFGSPRVGNFAYTSRVARLVPSIHRFVVGGDPVPKLPPAQFLGEQTKYGFQHLGVEILLDLEKIGLLIDPLFIERQIQHGWGGYKPQRHLTSSYVLALLLWNARAHPGYVPEWWLPVVNHVLRFERKRLAGIKTTFPNLVPSIIEQLEVEGAITWTDDMRSYKTVGVDTTSMV